MTTAKRKVTQHTYYLKHKAEILERQRLRILNEIEVQYKKRLGYQKEYNATRAANFAAGLPDQPPSHSNVPSMAELLKRFP